MIVFSFRGFGLDLRVPIRVKRCRSGDVDVGDWVFDNVYGKIYFSEYLEWKQYYLPPFDLKGKTVLDVGAGCGESAKFYLDNGAFRVICVEPSRECWPYLEKNAAAHSIHIVEDPFRPSMLFHEFDYDFVKMDIEGYETLMIPYLDHVEVPMVVECHNKYVIDSFLAAGFEASTPFAEDYQLRAQTMILHRWKT